MNPAYELEIFKDYFLMLMKNNELSKSQILALQWPFYLLENETLLN